MKYVFLLAAALFCTTLPVHAQETPAAHEAPDYKHFEVWLEEFREEAMAKGIKKSVLDDAFADIDEPSEDVLEKDQTQPEKKKTFPEYLKSVLTDKKIKAAREQWEKNRQLFIRLENKYKVQPQFLLALWAIESNFGDVQGSHSIVEALTTLAYDGRRSAFFRAQLLDALRILQQQNMRSADLLGSWAGAMGQVQFMPSSYLAFAVDLNNDGKKDIWDSTGDALASMANYLHQKGWDGNDGWGYAVSLPEGDKTDWASLKEPQPLSVWKKFGVRQKNGEMLRGVREVARLVLIDASPENAYLVFGNYDVLMDWNRSTYFATTVGLLADSIGEDQ